MEPKEKKAFEPSGLVPRSIVRTFERFRQQLLPGSETAAIREYRISRYQVLVSARCLFTLLIIPIATNWLVSSWLLSPLVEHFWNTQQNEIFLNSYQEERAFAELESFSEKLFFESLLNTTNTINVDLIPSSCNRNPSCYGKNFSSSSQSSVTNKLILGGEASEQDKSSIYAAKVNNPFNTFSKAWYFSSFYPTKTSVAELRLPLHSIYPERVRGMRNQEELAQRKRNSLPLDATLPLTGFLRTPNWGYGVEFIQYEKYLPLPNTENKDQLTPYNNSLTQPLCTKFSCSNSSWLRIPLTLSGYMDWRGNRSSATLVPWKFHANDANVQFARGQQLKNSLLTPELHTGYIEDLQTVRANDGVKAWGTEAKAPFLLSVPIESTYDNSLKIKEKVQNKILELAIYYNQQTIISITNIVGDVVSLVTLGCLFIWMKPEITILKSFLIEAIYSLSDTTKSFLLILLTDLLVGFHSPRGWETALELLLKHFGLPENQDFVFLFVATFPVLLDTVFKYWIFRHLNKISPSTVATYHSMIE